MRAGAIGPEDLPAFWERINGHKPVPAWPVFGLKGRYDAVLSEWSQDEGRVRRVEIEYGESLWGGSYTAIATAPDESPFQTSLHHVLSEVFAKDGIGYPIPKSRWPVSVRTPELKEVPGALVIYEDKPLNGEQLRLGTFSATRLSIENVVVTIVRNDAYADELIVEHIAYLDAAYDRRLARIKGQRYMGRETKSGTLPTPLAKEKDPLCAHRLLASILLSALHKPLSADGAQFDLPTDWASAWSDAMAQQRLLANETAPQARRTLLKIRDLLNDLGREPWWSPSVADDVVNEIGQYFALAMPGVSSAQAIQAWETRPLGSPSQSAVTDQAWKAQWAAWADHP